MPDKLILFTPGPVMTSPAVKQALAHADIPHRRPVFEAYLKRCRQNLLRLFNASPEYSLVMISGSGTAANESALSSVIKDTDEVLLLTNGVFGERLGEILDCYHYKVHRLEAPWGSQFDLQTVETALKDNPHIQWVCMVHHETSTGMLNPVGAVGSLAAAYGRKFMVDCVSALGAEDVNVTRDHIDVCTASTNKAIASVPGIGIVCVRRRAVPDLGADLPRRNIYLNLQNLVHWSDQYNQTPNTPAVNLFISLDTALSELFTEGLQERMRRHQECTHIIRAGLQNLGLRMLLPASESSNTVTCAFLPEGVGLNAFIDELEARGCVVYPGKGPFEQQNMFQVSTMGWIQLEDCHQLLVKIEETLQALEPTRVKGNIKDE